MGRGESTLIPPQNKLEAQYAAKRQAHENEVQDLKQQLEFKANEIRSLNTSIDSLKSVNEELKVCHSCIRWLAQRVRPLITEQRAFAVTSAGIEGGKNLAESAQDLERARKAISVQLAEFDGVKKNLMRDLQNRCEKVRWPQMISFMRVSSLFGRLSSWKSSWTKSVNNTTTSSETVTARLSRRRWRSWNGTSNS